MPNIAIRCCSVADTFGRTAFIRAPWTMHICGQRCATSSATRCVPDCAPHRRTGPGRARRRTSDGRRRHLGSICLPGERGLHLGNGRIIWLPTRSLKPRRRFASILTAAGHWEQTLSLDDWKLRSAGSFGPVKVAGPRRNPRRLPQWGASRGYCFRKREIRKHAGCPWFMLTLAPAADEPQPVRPQREGLPAVPDRPSHNALFQPAS